MALATTTRKAIRQAVIAKLYPHRFPTTSTTTSAASSVNQLNDTVLAGAGQTEDYLRSWVYIAETAAGSPPVGEIRRVINTDFDSSTSQLIVLPAFTDTINSGMDYELHYVYHPNRIHERINAILDNLAGETYIPLTLVPDGEMLLGTTANYTGSAGVTLAINTSQPLLHGQYVLEVACTAANDTVRTEPITGLLPGQPILVSADVYVESTTGDITMRLLDDDATTVIVSGDFARATARGWQTMQFTTQIPEGTEFLHVQFLNNATGSQLYYINNVIVLDPNQKMFNGHSIYSTPNILRRRTSLRGIMAFHPGSSISITNSTNCYLPLQHAPVPVSFNHVTTHDFANMPFRVVLPEDYTIQAPLFLRVKTSYTALTDDTTLSSAPEDIVVDLVLADMLDFMAEEARDNDDLQKMATYRADAVNVRRLLRPRMEDFSPQTGRVTSSNA